MLRIHNSLTGRKEEFREIDPGKVRMYCCGMTVYDYCHVGHARMLIVFDVVRRYLRWRGYDVTFVRNITDIDDNIIKRAAENGEAFDSLTARFITAMNEDCDALGIERPDLEPRATDYIPQIIAMIQTLIDKGYAYVADGDVLYSVSKFEAYGRLSGKKTADLRAGARVEIGEHKHDPLDFALWKAAKPGEPQWDSPWGAGRPGWHIECSAMSTSLLGPHFDIHGGGIDLKFPHHENEIAQSCAACDAPFVNLWMHNGHVRVDDEKMSKSLGNFFTVRDVLPKLRPEVMRAFVLASHYRGPVNYTEENLQQADAALSRLYIALRDVAAADPAPTTQWSEKFREAMDDDFNTPEGISVLQSLARELNSAKAAGDTTAAALLAGELKALAGVLGLLAYEPAAWLSMRSEVTAGEAAGDGLSDAQISSLVEARVAARGAKNWAESDRIRDELTAQGVILEDGAGGTKWRRK
jgi:cysteinyl-tRNA synthetase